MESRSAAFRFTSSHSPQEPPMTKARLLAPFTAARSIYWASWGEESSLPSMHKATIGVLPAF